MPTACPPAQQRHTAIIFLRTCVKRCHAAGIDLEDIQFHVNHTFLDCDHQKNKIQNGPDPAASGIASGTQAAHKRPASTAASVTASGKPTESPTKPLN